MFAGVAIACRPIFKTLLLKDLLFYLVCVKRLEKRFCVFLLLLKRSSTALKISCF